MHRLIAPNGAFRRTSSRVLSPILVLISNCTVCALHCRLLMEQINMLAGRIQINIRR